MWTTTKTPKQLIAQIQIVPQKKITEKLIPKQQQQQQHVYTYMSVYKATTATTTTNNCCCYMYHGNNKVNARMKI